MSKSKEIEAEPAVAVAEVEKESAAPVEPRSEPQRQALQVEVKDANVISSYANFCRVTGTPEELILDFGLNKNMNQNPHESIEISQRLIVNFFTAKRLLAALHMAVQRHEAAFGMLETDVQRRVMPAGRGR